MTEYINTSNQFTITQNHGFTNKGREKFLQENIKGVMGSTWDATHLTSFLNKSFYSNKKSPQKDEETGKKKSFSARKKSGEYYFKNLRHDKNQSKIGFTKINPLVSDVQVSKQKQRILMDFYMSRVQQISNKQQNKMVTKDFLRQTNKSLNLRCDQQSKFRFQANAVKFKATDPLTSRYVQKVPQKVGFSIQRMSRQLRSRYPHGVLGIDHPQNQQSQFYNHQKLKHQKLLQKSQRVRLSPMSQTSFELDREWKSKKRVIPVTEQFRFRHTQCIRKFRNDNVHGYNIVTNRKLQQ